MTDARLAMYQTATGHECPRRDLDPRNATAWRIAILSLSRTLRRIAPMRIRMLCEDMDRDECAAVLDRVDGALSDPEVNALLYPAPREPEKAERTR